MDCDVCKGKKRHISWGCWVIPESKVGVSVTFNSLLPQDGVVRVWNNETDYKITKSKSIGLDVAKVRGTFKGQ